MEPLLINPPAAELGRVNAILTGRSCRYGVHEFPGPLSVKSVLSGSAMWQVDSRRHVIHPGSALVLNNGQPYSMEIESRTPVETFCLFFRQGFVEDAVRVARSQTESLLDDPGRVEPAVLPVAACGPGGALARAMSRCRTDLASGVFLVAEVLAGLQRLPAVRLATRDELVRRVMRGREYLEAQFNGLVRLSDTAREACLSPFHFHRSFKAVFGEAPHEYVVRRRLETALDRLRRSDDTVTDIALQSGFETPSSFATAFRKHYGQSPRAFRKNGKVTTNPANRRYRI